MNNAVAWQRRWAFSMALLTTAVVVTVVISTEGKAQVVPVAASASLPQSQNESMYMGPALVLNAGDLIDVQVFETPELSGHFRLNQNGDLNIPLAGSIHIAGLTDDRAASAIERMLRTQEIMQDPHVHVNVDQYVSQGVSITGQVKKAGVYPLYGKVTLSDLLSVAGGLGEAAGSSITIAHLGSQEPTVIPINSPNYSEVQHTTVILPGDSVVVSAADFVFVVGDVGNQGQFPIAFGQQMTLLKLMAYAHGLTETSKGSKAAIVRQTATGTVTIDVNLADVMKARGKAMDFIIQPKDILVVPRSGLKTFVQIALPAITNSAANSAVTAVLVR